MPVMVIAKDPPENTKDGAEKGANGPHDDSKHTPHQTKEPSDDGTNDPEYATDDSDREGEQQYTNEDDHNGRDGFRIHMTEI